MPKPIPENSRNDPNARKSKKASRTDLRPAVDHFFNPTEDRRQVFLGRGGWVMDNRNDLVIQEHPAARRRADDLIVPIHRHDGMRLETGWSMRAVLHDISEEEAARYDEVREELMQSMRRRLDDQIVRVFTQQNEMHGNYGFRGIPLIAYQDFDDE